MVFVRMQLAQQIPLQHKQQQRGLTEVRAGATGSGAAERSVHRSAITTQT